jgi:membrane-associated phospholipid phosphatase
MEQPRRASFPVGECIDAARGATRRYLLHQISVTIGWMPHLHARLRGGALTRFFLAASACGEEGFYFAAVPVYMWLFDTGNALALVLLFACNLYVGNWLKNYLQLPRPPLEMRWDWPAAAGTREAAAEAAPGCARSGEELVALGGKCMPPTSGPADRDSGAGAPASAPARAPARAPQPQPLSQQSTLPAELTEMGYGWPSTHAMNAVALPFYLLRCAFTVALWELPGSPPMPACLPAHLPACLPARQPACPACLPARG